METTLKWAMPNSDIPIHLRDKADKLYLIEVFMCLVSKLNVNNILDLENRDYISVVYYPEKKDIQLVTGIEMSSVNHQTTIQEAHRNLQMEIFNWFLEDERRCEIIGYDGIHCLLTEKEVQKALELEINSKGQLSKMAFALSLGKLLGMDLIAPKIRTKIGEKASLLREKKRRVEIAKTEEEKIEAIKDLRRITLQIINSPLRENRTDKEAAQEKNGFVYLLYGGGFIKIGLTSRSPAERCEEFSPKLPFETRLIHVIEVSDPYLAEKFLHEKFMGRRTNGEWFKLSPEDIDWIKNWDGENYEV